MSLPTLTVRVAFRTDPDVAVPEWEDVSSYVRKLTVRRGRQHELDQVAAGTCTLELNNGDRRFDPTYTLSPYWPGVLPMRKVQVSATWNAVEYFLFTGYVERWPIAWAPPSWGFVEVTAVDAMAPLAQAQIVGVFPEEMTGERVARVLTAAQWPESLPEPGGYWTLGTSQLDTTTILSYGIPATEVDTGMTEVAAVTFDEEEGQSALAHIHSMVEAERGMFCITVDGMAMFHDRRDRYDAVSLVTFTDDQGAWDASHLPYQDLRPEFDVEQVRNEVIVTRDGGTPQTATDTDSVAKFFRRTLSLTPPLTTDAEALDRANFELMLRKEPRLEFDQLTVAPQGSDDVWPFALGLELADRVSLERTPGAPAGTVAETILRDGFVESVEHRADPGSWETSWQLSAADDLDQFFRLGSAELDSAASAVLAY